MLNVLWGSMMLIGILWGMYSGNLSAVTDGILESAKEAVTLCISMLGIMSFWSGILKIGEEAGLIASYFDEYDRKYAGTWLGGDAGRIACHGGIEKTGERKDAREKI